MIGWAKRRGDGTDGLVHAGPEGDGAEPVAAARIAGGAIVVAVVDVDVEVELEVDVVDDVVGTCGSDDERTRSLPPPRTRSILVSRSTILC